MAKVNSKRASNAKKDLFKTNSNKHKPIPAKIRLKGSIWLSRETLKLIYTNRFSFFKILVVYILIDVIFVLGFSIPGVNASTLKLTSNFKGSLGSLYKGINLFGFVLNSSSSNSSNPAAPAYAAFLFIVLGLVLFWSFRKIYLKQKFHLKEAYYNAMAPLIPYILVTIVVVIEFIPLSFALVLYNYVFIGGIAVGSLEKMVWALIIILLAILSFFLLSGSIFALPIVTKPGVNPVQALRKARQITKGLKLQISGRLIFGIISGLLGLSIIMILIAMSVPTIAGIALQLLSVLIVLYFFCYLFVLYMEIGDEQS